jgi:hypothetical protein
MLLSRTLPSIPLEGFYGISTTNLFGKTFKKDATSEDIISKRILKKYSMKFQPNQDIQILGSSEGSNEPSGPPDADTSFNKQHGCQLPKK